MSRTSLRARRTRMLQRRAATKGFVVSDAFDALSRLKKSTEWLRSHGIRVLGYSVILDIGEPPDIMVQSGPKTFALFAGQYTRRSVYQTDDGEVADFEADDRKNGVRINWTEVPA